jgi:hypothetical protein
MPGGQHNPYAAPVSYGNAVARAPARTPGVGSWILAIVNLLGGALGCLGAAHIAVEAFSGPRDLDSVLLTTATTMSALALLVTGIAFARSHRLRWWLQLSPFVIFFGLAALAGILT